MGRCWYCKGEARKFVYLSLDRGVAICAKHYMKNGGERWKKNEQRSKQSRISGSRSKSLFA